MNGQNNICIYNAKLQGEEFVGIKIENGEPKVYFPLGYSKSSDLKQEKRDILNLISVLSTYGTKTDGNLTKSDSCTENFPIHAYIGVFTYYLNHGYYSENEIVFKRRSSGKISWNKTIKHVRPQVLDNTVFYLDFIKKKNALNELSLITQIHKYCVCESYKKIGVIFDFPRPEKSLTLLKKELFITVLQKKIANTFNERDLRLFHDMLDMLRFLAKDGKPETLLYGTTDFEYVWEGLVNKVFGIPDKRDFTPRTNWRFLESNLSCSSVDDTERSPLRPDTIMFSMGKFYVLDSKYYKYGITKNSCHLPESSSVLKQLAYAEYIENHMQVNSNEILNAFILPYDSESDKWAEEEKEGEYKLLCFGSVIADWKKNNKPYERIRGILLDVRSIMYKHSEGTIDCLLELADIISQQGEK